MSLTVSEATEKFRSFVESRRDPSWLAQKRREALKACEELDSPPPPTKDRNFPNLDPTLFPVEEMGSDLPFFSAENPDVTFLHLEEALRCHEEKIREHLGEISRAGKNKWALLNQAVWQGGSFVLVPKNVDAGSLVLRHEPPQDTSLFFPRVLVLAEPGSRIILLDHYLSSSCEKAFAAPVIEIVAEKNSEVYYVQIQESGKGTHHHSFANIIAKQDARVTAISCLLGGKRTVNRLETSLQGQGSQAQILGLVLGERDQVFEHYTLQEHLAPQTESDLLIKVALKGKAYSHFDGLIRIEKGASKTNAYQQNRNLLLSLEAKAESTPRLEILENDVRCTHGATVGPVDEEQVFYLASRGIAEEEAEALIVQGFFQQVLERIPVESLREKLWSEVSSHLRKDENGKLA